MVKVDEIDVSHRHRIELLSFKVHKGPLGVDHAKGLTELQKYYYNLSTVLTLP